MCVLVVGYGVDGRRDASCCQVADDGGLLVSVYRPLLKLLGSALIDFD